MARSRVTLARWRGRHLTLVSELSCQIHMERPKFDRWAREAALLGLLVAELVPAPVPPGW